jgi:hypothetical protein
MSRAFVKEIDDAPAILHDRAVIAAPNRVTPRGAALIAQEIADLERALPATSDPEAVAMLRREPGDVVEFEAAAKREPVTILAIDPGARGDAAETARAMSAPRT